MTRLVNVRLDRERLRKAKVLRDRGVTLSDLVREAIDTRFVELHPPMRPRDVRDQLARIFTQHPDSADLPPRLYDPHDRTQARDAIRQQLRGRRRRRR
jgi:hypothetical protein